MVVTPAPFASRATVTPFYVVRCASGREKTACELLAGRGIQALAPMTRQFEIVSRKRIVSTECACWPGYLFVQLADSQWGDLKGLSLVNPQPLTADGEPYVLTAADVAWLEEMARNSPRDPRDRRRMQAGDAVSIVRGPFSGQRGTVAQRVSNRLRVLVAMLGRMTAVYVDEQQLELA
jgi:transcription antitermination factor NusG